MLCSLSPHIRTWWQNHPLMFPSTRVGWSGLSCFSLAICGPGAHGCREGPITCTARTTSKSNSCSTAPSSPWSCQWAALWTLWACRSCTHPHPRPFCLWPRRQCAGARALDVPVPPRQLYSDHPTPAPPAPERQVSTSAGRCSHRVGQEGEQRHVPTCTRSTNGCD